MTFQEAQIDAHKYANTVRHRVFIIRRGLEYQVTQNLKSGWKYIATVYSEGTQAV